MVAPMMLAAKNAATGQVYLNGSLSRCRKEKSAIVVGAAV
jgi:hypothetical protein